jgi:hypothetical protein
MHPSPAQRPTAGEILSCAAPAAAKHNDFIASVGNEFIFDVRYRELILCALIPQRPINSKCARVVIDTQGHDMQRGEHRALHTPTEHVLPLNWG